MYLWKRDSKWDSLASSAAELGGYLYVVGVDYRTNMGEARLGGMVDVGRQTDLHPAPLADITLAI